MGSDTAVGEWNFYRCRVFLQDRFAGSDKNFEKSFLKERNFLDTSPKSYYTTT